MSRAAPVGAWCAGAAVLLACLPGSARAHGSGKGLGAFWNGMAHAWGEPAQLLALLALGLWLGVGLMARLAPDRAALAGAAAFVVAAVAAAASGQALALADGGLPEHLLQVAGLALALCVVADWRPTRPWLAAAACALVLAAIALGSPAGALRGIDAAGWITGVALGAGLIVSYTALAAAELRKRFRVGPIVPRVLASWLAASLLLVAMLPLLSGGRAAAVQAPMADPAAAVPRR